MVGNMVLVFYLARVSDAEGVGIYGTVMAVFTMAHFACAIGFESFIPRELPRDLSQTNRYLIHACLIAPATGLPLMAIIFLIVPHLGYLPQTIAGIYIISLAFIPVALQVVLNAIFLSHQKAEFITVTSLIGVIARILISLLLLHLGSGIISLFIVYTVIKWFVISL